MSALDLHFLGDDSLAVRRSRERGVFPLVSVREFLVVLIRPSLLAAVGAQRTRGLDTSRFAAKAQYVVKMP